jgi:SAP domain-containing protein
MAEFPEPRVTASDNPTVAKRHGLTAWSHERQQWVRPTEDTQEDVQVTDEDTEGSDDTLLDEAVDYSSWEYPALQAECRRRSLEATGKKADLVARLTEDDELANEEDED